MDPLLPKQVRYQAALHADNQYSNLMQTPKMRLPWLEPEEIFPPVENAWGAESDAPGLLAAGADLSVDTLLRAYGQGIFPWFSEGQPILWWSTNPRMTLQVANFRLHRSLKKKLQQFNVDPRCEVRFDSAFRQVIEACASSPRDGQAGTWIVPDMVNAYTRLHEAGHAHSVETWIDGELVGGLYCVAIGQAVFGESMFTRATDASKIALAALVAFCLANHVAMIDCQQNTKHLASLGATEMARTDFIEGIRLASGLPTNEPAIQWQFNPIYWSHLLGH